MPYVVPLSLPPVTPTSEPFKKIPDPLSFFPFCVPSLSPPPMIETMPSALLDELLVPFSCLSRTSCNLRNLRIMRLLLLRPVPCLFFFLSINHHLLFHYCSSVQSRSATKLVLPFFPLFFFDSQSHESVFSVRGGGSIPLCASAVAAFFDPFFLLVPRSHVSKQGQPLISAIPSFYVLKETNLRRVLTSFESSPFSPIFFFSGPLRGRRRCASFFFLQWQALVPPLYPEHFRWLPRFSFCPHYSTNL